MSLVLHLLVTGYWALLFSLCTDSKAPGCIASLSPSDKPEWQFTEMFIQKRALANEDASAAKKWKVITPEVKLDVIGRLEYGNSKAKIGWDQNLNEATV